MHIIDHPWFQRLRRIKQMGIAHFVYPGAVHTRFHHSLGATHLMNIALNELAIKGIDISKADALSAKQAILLHDIGHGPFSHALEFTLIHNIQHEEISKLIFEHLNEQWDGKLTNALAIFENKHPESYLHQLVSSQLDMDRMDYLNRDSYYSGVSEGVIGYDRILQMLTVVHDQLVVEEKGIQSVEKFVLARRLMYWQVYLHKTVLGAEHLIVNILKRAKELALNNVALFATPALKFFLYEQINRNEFLGNKEILPLFCQLDDDDIMSGIKVWMHHPDQILSDLCNRFLNRNLYKVKLSSQPLHDDYERISKKLLSNGDIQEEDLHYYLFVGTTSNDTYDPDDEQIDILFKDGEVKSISKVDNALINELTSVSIKK